MSKKRDMPDPDPFSAYLGHTVTRYDSGYVGCKSWGESRERTNHRSVCVLRPFRACFGCRHAQFDVVFVRKKNEETDLDP